MYINAVANSVMLVILCHDFYNILLKIKHKLHIASQGEKLLVLVREGHS